MSGKGTWLALALVLAVACGGGGSELRSYSAATPSPRSASLDGSVTFASIHPRLGDAEKLVLDITTSVPTQVRLYIYLFAPQGGIPGVPMYGCATDPCMALGGARAEWYWPGRAPAGQYHIVMVAYSYNHPTSLTFQTRPYMEWVGEHGTKLAGNPLAVRDPLRPEVLNLRQELQFSH